MKFSIMTQILNDLHIFGYVEIIHFLSVLVDKILFLLVIILDTFFRAILIDVYFIVRHQ